MRRSVAVTTWAVATVVVCALAWTAVDRVAADVTDHPTVVGSRTIRNELSPRAGAAARGPGADPDPSAATSPDGVPLTGTAGSGDDGGANATSPGTDAPTSGGASTGTGVGGGSRPATGGTGGGNVAGSPTTTTTTTPPPPPTTTPTAPPTGPEASVVTAGGSVTAACSSGTPRLVRAVPNAGYGVQTRTNGSQLIVTLRSIGHESIVEIECEGTRVHFSTSEESTD